MNPIVKKSNLPDFLIIGAGKSGTTSLNNYLKQHPQIFIPDLKEPNFYGYELNTTNDFKGLPILEHYKNSVTDLESYLALFNHAEESQIKGETSNTYLYHKNAPDRIYHYIPNVKIIAVLRQPVERLYSRYLHLARENRLPTKRFIDCLDRSSIWWQRNDLINEGFYYKHLLRYYNLFNKSNIRVFLYEDFVNEPQKMIGEIFEFLGVDKQYEPDISINYNKSGFIKNKFVNKLVGQEGIARKLIYNILPENIYQRMKKNLFFQKNLNKIRAKNLYKPKLEDPTKSKITNDIYREDILNLSRLIEKDLGHWLS